MSADTELEQAQQQAQRYFGDIVKLKASGSALMNERDALVKALRPFVIAYDRKADHIGDSDLYPEQPRSVAVTLGDCRTARRVLREIAP